MLSEHSVLGSDPVQSKACAKSLPKSSSNELFNYTALVLTILVLCLFRKIELHERFVVIFCVLTYSITILALEWRFSKPVNIPTAKTKAIHLSSITCKLTGLYLTFLSIAFLYWIFPEYRKPMFDPCWLSIKELALPLIVLSIPYVALMDTIRNEKDAYWLIGAWLFRIETTKYPYLNKKRLLSQHILSWLVKAFFLPLMFVYCLNNVKELVLLDFTSIYDNIEQFFYLSTLVLFSIDVLGALTGYVFTLKLTNTQIESTESNMFGWVVCLICYAPFNYTIGSLYFMNTYGQYRWSEWLSDYPYIAWIWAFTSLGFLVVYAMSTVAFGVRFSNLTNRGLISSGPYRWSKHPAYLSKNIFWWLTTVPFAFFLTDPSAGIQYTCFLLAINGIYFLRARTEEAHLSSDPQYVAYALWMNQHGVLAPLQKWLPWLRYQEPKLKNRNEHLE